MDNNFEQIYEKYRSMGEGQGEQDTNQAASDQEKIIAVRKNEDGDIIAFKTESGRQLDYLTALDEAKAGKLAHVDVFHKYGRDIIRSEPDGVKENNLSNLDTF
nr:DUF3892 domain-containing protein [Virgibacillus sp. SK37]